MARTLSADAVRGFRLARQGLLRPAPAATSVGELAPLGLQDTADHVATWALALRRAGARPVGRLVADGDLVATYGPRCAATLADPERQAMVTTALLDEEAADDEIAGLVTALAPYAVERTRELGPLTKEDLGGAIADRVPAWAMQDCERCGREHPSDGLVKALAWSGRLRLEADEERPGRVAAAARWRPRRFRRATDDDRAGLVRTYLRLYAPSTPAAFAQWAGIERPYADRCWSLVAEETAPAPSPDQPRAEALEADLDELASPPDPPRARLVPAYDPLLQLRDRATLVPEPGLRREVWRAVANPGVVVTEGGVTGTWRGRRRGDRLEITLTSGGLPRGAHEAIAEDAERLAAAIGCEQTTVERG